MHYKALFFNTNSGDQRKRSALLNCWLQSQLQWFIDLLAEQLAVPCATTEGTSAAAGTSTARAGPPGGGSSAGAAAAGATKLLQLDAAGLATVLKCVTHCATTLRMLGCYFYPAVQDLFHLRLLHIVQQHCDRALETFQIRSWNTPV